MDRDEFSRDYALLTEKIAEEYQDRHVPLSVQAYYLLAELIANGSIGSFIQTYGQRKLDINAANEGKQVLNLGKLDDFEVAAIELLNEVVS